MLANVGKCWQILANIAKKVGKCWQSLANVAKAWQILLNGQQMSADKC